MFEVRARSRASHAREGGRKRVSDVSYTVHMERHTVAMGPIDIFLFAGVHVFKDVSMTHGFAGSHRSSRLENVHRNGRMWAAA